MLFLGGLVESLPINYYLNQGNNLNEVAVVQFAPVKNLSQLNEIFQPCRVER